MLNYEKLSDRIFQGKIKYNGTYDNITNLDSKIMDLLGKDNKSPDDEQSKSVASHEKADAVSVSSNNPSVDSLAVSQSRTIKNCIIGTSGVRWSENVFNKASN